MSDEENYPPEFDLKLNQQLIIDGFTFTPERVVGRGSFGIVYLIKSPEFKEPLALKLVVQDKRYKNREYELLQQLNHPNITQLLKGFLVNGYTINDQILYLIMPYYPETITSIYKEYVRLKEHVPLAIVRLVMFQTAKALLYIHKQGIAHRDVKPNNILVDPSNLRAALCDFGSAKELEPGEPNVSYICSRHVRAPELILGNEYYDQSIDTWSFGCILAEILLGEPIFPGETTADQLVEIIKVLGSPTQEDFKAMNKSLNTNRFKEVKPYGLQRVFRSKAHADAVNLLEKLLVYNPAKRLTAAEILAHEFFDPVRELAKQLPGGEEIPEDLFEFSEIEVAALEEANTYEKVMNTNFGVSNKEDSNREKSITENCNSDLKESENMELL